MKTAIDVDVFVYAREKCLNPNSIAKGGWFCATCNAAMLPKIYSCYVCRKQFAASSIDRICNECHTEGF